MRTTATLKSNFWTNGKVEILTKEQQRQILGGTYYCSYRVTYPDGSYYQQPTGACASSSKTTCNSYAYSSGQQMASNTGGTYDSRCCTTTPNGC